MSAKKGLGRGFDSLIPTDLFDETFDPTASQDVKVSELREMEVSLIEPNPDQPRRRFDQQPLAELADSIREHGVLQPLIVIKHGDKYQIVAGERRFLASKQAGLTRVPVIIRTMSGQKQLEVSLIENVQRRDLNVVEIATAYAKLRDQFNMNIEQVASRVNKSISAVTNTMRLLKLPRKVLEYIADSKLTEGQARPLIGLSDESIEVIIDNIVAENWSARRVEQYASSLKKQTGPKGDSRAVADYSIEENQLTQRLGAKVSIKSNARGAGKIVIAFKNADELERIKKTVSQ